MDNMSNDLDKSAYARIQEETKTIINNLMNDCNTKYRQYLFEVEKNYNNNVKNIEAEAERFKFTVKSIGSIIHASITHGLQQNKDFIYSTSINDNLINGNRYVSLDDYYSKNPACKEAFRLMSTFLQNNWHVTVTLLNNGIGVVVNFAYKLNLNVPPANNNIQLITSTVNLIQHQGHPPQAQQQQGQVQVQQQGHPPQVQYQAQVQQQGQVQQGQPPQIVQQQGQPPQVQQLHHPQVHPPQQHKNPVQADIVLSQVPHIKSKRSLVPPPNAPKKLILHRINQTKNDDIQKTRPRERSQSPKRTKL